MIRQRRAMGAVVALLLAGASAAGAANEKGRLTAEGNGYMQRRYQYDVLGRVQQETHTLDGRPYVFSTTYTYPAGVTTGLGTVPHTLTFPDGEMVTYSYDADGQLDTITAGGEPIVKGITRNARGQASDVVYGNDVRTIRRYNEGGDLRLNLIKSCRGPISPQACAGGATTLQHYTYTYDSMGNVRSVLDPLVGGTFSSTNLEYDTLDQLILRTSGGVSSTYAYDALGNLTDKEGVVQTYGPGHCGDGRRGPHALALAGNDCYTYDDNGNVTSTSSGLSLTWDSQDMATRLSRGGATAEKSFFGGRVWKKTDGGVTTYYLPSMRDDGGRLRKYYGAFAERSGPEDGQRRFYHRDHLGSSTVLTNAAANVDHRSAFKPYGADVDGGAGGFVPKLRFNFKEIQLGVYDYGPRLYNPATGRWLSADPMLADGPNRYAYVRNNPLAYIDPSGYGAQDPVPDSSQQEYLLGTIETNVDQKTGDELSDEEVYHRRFGLRLRTPGAPELRDSLLAWVPSQTQLLHYTGAAAYQGHHAVNAWEIGGWLTARAGRVVADASKQHSSPAGWNPFKIANLQPYSFYTVLNSPGAKAARWMSHYGHHASKFGHHFPVIAQGLVVGATVHKMRTAKDDTEGAKAMIGGMVELTLFETGPLAPHLTTGIMWSMEKWVAAYVRDREMCPTCPDWSGAGSITH